MTYSAFLIANPLFWSAVGGVSLGGAIASATRSVKHERRPDRSRSRKWTAAALWATAGVLAVTCGVLFPDATEFLRPQSLHVGLGSLVFTALALRFPRAAGIPAILIIAIVAMAGPLVMRGFVPIRDRGVVATARVLTVDESGAYIEVEDHTPGTAESVTVIVTTGPTVVGSVHWLEISQYLFFLGARGGLVFESLLSEGPTDDPVPILQETPVVKWIIDSLPLVVLTRVASEPTRLGLLRQYQVVGLPDGNVYFRESNARE